MGADPLTLLLPAWMVDRFDLARVLAETGRWSWSEGYRLLERFDMSGPERDFVQTVLARRTNLWLYRCNQREVCGDFIVVDLSPPDAADRPALVVELKTGEPLAFGGARRQLARAAEAVAEIAASGVLGHTRFEQVQGDPAAVLGHLRAKPP
ncbi:MAG TPA: hypothetical protein VHE35_36260 [Kofleriaceae bacterium]|nr:hypothetical protein [Kofleriaceae bacterium]